MKTITLAFKKSEILYDVENASYLVGNSRSDGSNFEQVSNIQNSGEGEDMNFILRSIDSAFGKAKTILSRFINESATTVINTLIGDSGDLSIALKVMDAFNEASTDILKSSIHEYIVASCLEDWFANMKSEDVTIYQNRKKDAYATILVALYRKKAPVRSQ